MGKRLIIIILVLSILVMGNVAFADPPAPTTSPAAVSTPPTKSDSLPSALKVKNKSGDLVKEYVEKDPKKLAQIIKKDKLTIPKGYHLVSVTTTIINSTAKNESTNQIIQASTVPYWYVTNVRDMGDGYSYWDDYDSDWFYGPATISEQYSRTDSCSFNCSLGISASVVSASVGFTIGSSLTKTKTFNASVAAGYKLNVKIFTNYQQKSYVVNYVDTAGVSHNYGTYNAWKPVGLIFKQYTYAA